METNFEELIAALSTFPLSSDVLYHITLHLQQQNLKLLPSFISQSYQSILILEHWAWKLLSQNCHQLLEEPNYLELFHTLALFNKNLIFNYDNIENDNKASLLIPDTIDWIHSIFEQIKKSNDENETYIKISSLWFDNLSYFLHDNSQFEILPTIVYISHYIGKDFLMTDQFKYYLIQFQQSQMLKPIFTAKQLFYIKTCSFFLSSCFAAQAQNFSYTPDQILEYLGENYFQIIHFYTQNIESWNEYILTSCAHLIGLISACCWWSGEKQSEMKVFFPTEQITCNHTQALIRIISFKPFYDRIIIQRSNDETILMDSTLLLLIHIIQTLNINWFFRSMIQLSDTLLIVAETSVFDKICLYAYGILGEILTDEQLKDLKIVDSIEKYFYNMLDQSWHHPSKKYKQIPIIYLLRGFLTFSKNDTIQQETAKSNKILFFIEMCDQYPIVFEIIWALSFNRDIQQQLRSNTSFMTKLIHIPKEFDDARMQKITHGILWNLESNRQDRTLVESSDEKTFDIMISYSHKDAIICRQIYDELIKAGYLVWIDFDQMHGNVMDAMAQAIERSHTIIICMSDQYRRSNYCRAEAHYAFQSQRKIVPVLVEEHYKPDSWLLFLIGQLLYVNFTKYQFSRAMQMLFKELEAPVICKIDKTNTEYKQENVVTSSVLQKSPLEIAPILKLPENILDWTQVHVHDWLIEHNLVEMSDLLSNCDGRSLAYLNEFIKNGEIREILSLLKEDSLRHTNKNLSLVELSCFRSLMDQQTSLFETTISSQMINTNSKKKKKNSLVCCRTM